jgi:hypothetical protein
MEAQGAELVVVVNSANESGIPSVVESLEGNMVQSLNDSVGDVVGEAVSCLLSRDLCSCAA